MYYRLLIVTFVLIFSSCTPKTNLPSIITEQMNPKMVKFNGKFPTFSFSQKGVNPIKGLADIITFKDLFKNRSKDFDIEIFASSWKRVKLENDFSLADSDELKDWFDITGLLFQISGEAMYAEELEKLAMLGLGSDNKENKNIIAPYIFTRNVDHLHVNLFTPTSISYAHSLGGDIHVEMNTNYPVSGLVELNFGMTEKRYIEVFIRIPSWAEGTTVTVKKVKYYAPPGGYCKIAKKWKEGDLVEIRFPEDKIPETFKKAV